VQALEVDASVYEQFKAKLPSELLVNLVIERSPSGKFLFLFDTEEKPEYEVLARDQNGTILIRKIIREIPYKDI
jgi:hypothetical protein